MKYVYLLTMRRCGIPSTTAHSSISAIEEYLAQCFISPSVIASMAEDFHLNPGAGEYTSFVADFDVKRLEIKDLSE